jgi:hypothetical protein
MLIFCRETSTPLPYALAMPLSEWQYWMEGVEELKAREQKQMEAEMPDAPK